VPKLFDDAIILEFQEEEWKAENSKSPIITPEMIKDREEGQNKVKVYPHFFKVVQLGPDCVKVKLGDRLIMKPPTLQRQPTLNPIVLFKDGKKVIRYITWEQDVAGVE
jgi:hypothetical protein